MQLLLVLGALIGLTFTPLYFSLSTYMKVSLMQVRQRSALTLARSVAEHIAERQAELAAEPDQTRLLALLSAEVQGGAVRAAFVFDEHGQVLARAGLPALMDTTRELSTLESSKQAELELDPTDPEQSELRANAQIWATHAKGRLGSVVTLTEIPRTIEESANLSELMALYLGVSAFLVLVVAYLALTRWMVEPIISLEAATRRIAEGSRRFVGLERAPAELAELSQSLSTMTERLFHEEEALRKKIEEVETTTSKLEKTQASLVRSERLASVGRLSAGLAHEIGNPISALMGLIDLLNSGGLTEEEQHDFLRRMKRETVRIHRVLGDLLAFARPDGPLRKPLLGEGSIAQAGADVVALLRPQKELTNIHLELEFAPNLPAVPLSQEELTQILLNLTMNAADACAGKGTIRLSALATDGSVQLSVQDDGPGVPESIRKEIFEPFFTTKEVGKGTGLGLAVTRGLVEGVAGTIELITEGTQGAHFLITLPTIRHSRSSFLVSSDSSDPTQK